MVYIARDIPFLDEAIQQVASKAVPDEFFVRNPATQLHHSFTHLGIKCQLSVIAGSTPMRHNKLPTVGCNYLLNLGLPGPDGRNTVYSFCVVEPTDDHASNRKGAIQCLHFLKATEGILFVQHKVTS